MRYTRQGIETPALLSTVWIAILLANLFRDVHEVLRPGFVDELAHEGTNYGRLVSNTTLLVSGLLLAGFAAVVVLARILPRVWNRRVNVAAAAMMAAGVLASWPKDPDDFVFGTVQLAGVGLIVAVCVAWRTDSGPAPSERRPESAALS